MTIWTFLLIFSCICNLGLSYYVYWLLKTISAINIDTENLTVMIKDFTEHTKSLYELEMFYGDETLKSLLEHGNMLVERISEIDLVLNDEKEPDE